MKVIAGAMGLIVALTLTVAAGAFAQMTPQGDSNSDNMTTSTNDVNPTSTDPTTPPAEDPSTSTPAPTAPAPDCASEIAGMNTVLNALPAAERISKGSAGQLPDIPCDGYSYAADFTIVPDTPPATPAAPQPQAPTTPVVPQA